VNPRLDRLITVEVPPTGQESAYGTATGDWTALAYLPGSPAVAEKFWAEVRDVRPSRMESAPGGLEMSKTRARLIMRWRDDIDSSMRVKLHGDTDTVWQIVGGPADVGMGRKKFIELAIEKYSSEAANA